MIFLRYESFRSYLRYYPGTAALIAINLIVFIIAQFYKEIVSYGMFLAVPGLDSFGFLEPWRYITSQFLHVDFGHFFFNMFALLVFAPPLEYLLKTFKYIVFYVLCGIGGNLLSALVTNLQHDPYHAAIGASGAIYGVYGAFLFIALLRKSMLDVSSRKTVYIILAFGVIHSIFVPKIDLWGHIGGALAGFLLYGLLDNLKQRRRR
ncbi:rhomboid family intramembrane serine protease [Paenibacillus agaridevorans]|uniref:Rhomboid family intramembrane serine protease n=1 Tax=Paenibacillus agaridevorans TaxID=171404 RepID=A0A2R5F5U9_9BACL|nr:rhomboid family intramembrane serine protease [Paenibacillus agaridevorans]GBG12253.1 rhomboid family intramembrane serine protease [Paenibacillus agaridevorans]